jgi:methylase of polypeptide subunit release factors
MPRQHDAAPVRSSALGHTGEMSLTFRRASINLLLYQDVAAPNHYTNIILEYLESCQIHGVSIGDLGSGTGIISIVASRFLGASKVWAIDVNPSAVELTHRNCARNGCEQDRITVEWGDIRHARPQSLFDLLVGNSPQIPSLEDNDPAASGGTTGRATMETMIQFARASLSETGTLLMTAAEFVGIEAVCSFCESAELSARTVKTKVCTPGAYTLRNRSHIEKTGYAFRETNDGPTFLLHLLSIRRKPHVAE